MRHISDKQPENIGLTVIVTQNPVVNTLYQVGCKVHSNIQRYFVITRTMDEALTMIAEERKTLELA
jgi:hypothetical protein